MDYLNHAKPEPWGFKIYAAGKVWQAPKFQELRDKQGYPINSRWIDLDNEGHIVKTRKDILWTMCLEDVKNSALVVLFCEKYDEEHKGTLMECGHAMALGKPIYCIGKAKTFVASPISDVAFTHHPLWHWTKATTLAEGFNEAINSFKLKFLGANYLSQFH